MSLSAAFMQKIKVEGECWIWQGPIDGKRYGFYWTGKTSWKAHRWAYYKTTGVHPKKKQVCHKCDNPRCVNPDHLFLGTNHDNSMDMLRKGRFYNQKKTHCPRGHAYDMVLQTKSGLGIERRCRTCAVEATRRWRERNGQ